MGNLRLPKVIQRPQEGESLGQGNPLLLKGSRKRKSLRTGNWELNTIYILRQHHQEGKVVESSPIIHFISVVR